MNVAIPPVAPYDTLVVGKNHNRRDDHDLYWHWHTQVKAVAR